VNDALSDLPNLNRFARLLDSDEVALTVEAVAEIDRAASDYARRLRGLDRDSTDLSYRRLWDRALLTGSIRTQHTDVSVRRFRATKHGQTEPVSRFYRLDPAGLCNTLRAGSGSERGAFTSPRPIHPYLPRVISNREAARLHSFPDWFRLHATKWHGFRQIGNAVAPLVGRAVGAEIVGALRVAPPCPTEAIQLGDIDLLGLTMSQAARRFDAEEAHIPAKRTRGALPRAGDEQRSAKVLDQDTGALGREPVPV
jgi:DNA (cytosine-5)-methyltransferase 1